MGTGKVYLYAARGHEGCNVGDNHDQLEIFDVTNPAVPVFKRSLTLSGSNPPSGSCPGGWLVKYYDDRVYVVTRFTAGFEFHIFDVSNPLSPSEIGPGYKIGGTANALAVTNITVDGELRRVAFLATERSAMEIIVLDVTEDPSDTACPHACLVTSYDLTGTTDAYSIQLLGNKLYVGRQKTTGGPELYVFGIAYGEDVSSKLTTTLTPLGTGGEINADVKYLNVVGSLAFMATSLTNDEFQVWNIKNPVAGVTRVDTSPIGLPNKVVGGMDYEHPYIYLGSQATNPLQILYSAP